MKIKKTWVIAIIGLCCIWGLMQVHAQMTNNSGSLDGVHIVVDPGHGGKDDGARKENVKEQEINLLISLKLKEELEKQGAKVTLTRDGAYDLASDGATNRKREDMKNRVAMINEEDNDLFISVHLNAYPNVAIQGAHAFYRKGDVSSKALADIVQKHFNTLTKKEKESKSGDYYILNQTEKPGILVECGFISNAEERSHLQKDSYQQQLANALCKSIMEYLDVLTI